MTRHVVSTAQVIHLWAHQPEGQDYATNGKHNTHYEGAKLYHYRCCIGNIVKDAKGNSVALILDDYPSHTTKERLGSASSAVRGVMPAFRVPYLRHTAFGRDGSDLGARHVSNVAFYLSNYAELIGQAGRARDNGPWLLERAIDVLATARDYAATFDVPSIPFPEAIEAWRNGTVRGLIQRTESGMGYAGVRSLA